MGVGWFVLCRMRLYNGRSPIQEPPVQGLVSIGILLIIAWAVAFVIFKVAGFLIHLLVIVGVIMLLVGFFRRMGGGVSSGR